ncbi:uncharacterized protein LOC110901001 [Helianthus annuus]|uniref:uncharacterized protein LOC110901001 n=1 Tax=Helianthus annuus TaxID=4232 RepID=UPI000B9008B0|nr:uncharacterized protein LOC110901001 [Helianthus annuus]
MDSPSFSSMVNFYYKEFFADDDETTDEEVAQEAVTSACQLAARYVKHCRWPEPEIKTRGYVEQDRRAAHDRLMKDYFHEPPTFSNQKIFRCHFRMSKRLFLRIVDDLETNYYYFKQKADAKGTLGFTGIQKCTSALRVLAYVNTTDIDDEYLKMAEKTTRDTLEHFCRGARYLRTPTWDDLQKIYEVHSAEHSLPGMIGSLDCMHWRWDNCPTAWRGQHTRADQKGPTVILQAVASQDLWVWYSIVVKTFSDPIDEKRAHFKKIQESSRKDTERCFGVLKQR